MLWDVWQEHLPSVAEAALALLVDPSPRVRFQALQLTGRLSDLYPVEFQVGLSKTLDTVMRTALP